MGDAPSAGFYVELNALDAAASGINDTFHDMSTIKIEKICGPEEMYGSGQLRDAFEHFCDRWQEGVEILLKDTGQIAGALTDAAAIYRVMDETSADALSGQGVVGTGDV
jgi:hypothetical protein